MTTAFCDVTHCSLVRGNQRSSEPLPQDTVSQSIVTPVRTPYFTRMHSQPESRHMSLGSVPKCWLANCFVVLCVTTARCNLIAEYQGFRAASSGLSSTLKMEAICSSKTVVPTARCHYMQDLSMNLIPQMLQVFHKLSFLFCPETELDVSLSEF
jgi:hypothetical protein